MASLHPFSGLLLALLALTAAFTLISATNEASRDFPDTNAERLKRGLPLKKPRSLDPSRTDRRYRDVDRRQTLCPSLTPGYPGGSGVIQINFTNGTRLGWIQDFYNYASELTYTTHSGPRHSNDYRQRFTLPQSCGGWFSFQMVSPIQSKYPYVGAGEGHDSPYLGQEDWGHAFLTGSSYSDPLTAPSTSTSEADDYASTYGFFGGYGESGIWQIDPVTLQLTAGWTDPDGTLIYPCDIYQDYTQDYLGLTANFELFQSSPNTDPDERYPVFLYFVPGV